MPNIDVTEDRAPRDKKLNSLKLPGGPRSLPMSAVELDPGADSAGLSRDLGGFIDQQTGVISISSEGGGFNDVLMRGFTNTPFFRNGLNDSLGELAPRSLLSIERIEILKGPIAALLGPGEPGGAINFVTKKPQAQRHHEFSAGYGSYDIHTLGLDTTGALPLNPSWQYRIIGERHGGDTFRDKVKTDRWHFSPALAYQASSTDRVQLSVDFVRDRRLFDAGTLQTVDGRRTPRRQFLGDPGLEEVLREGLTIQAGYSRSFNNGWNAEWQLQTQRTRLEGPAVEPAELNGKLLVREVQQLNEVTESWVAQFEIDGRLNWAETQHDLVLGLEAIGLEEDTLLHASDTDEDPFLLDLRRPVHGLPLPALTIERQSLERRRQYALYARDLVTLTAQWRLLLGVRLDYIDQSGRDKISSLTYDDVSTRLSPRASILYDSGDAWLTYASYSQSVDPNEGLRPDGSALAPTHAKSIELGARWTHPALQLSFDSAAYLIRQINVTVDAPNNPGFEIQSAKQQSIGIDLSLSWSPLENTEIALDYQWLDTRLFDDPTIPDGLSALNAPRHQAGVRWRHRLSLPFWRATEIGMSARYIGKRQASLDEQESTIKLADYVRVELFVSKEINRACQLRFGIENLFDENYIQGSQSDAFSLRPGAPISLWFESEFRW